MKYLLPLFFFICSLYGETLVMTHAFNSPEFIEWQAKTFAKHLKDPYRFIVFNDAPNGALCKSIETACRNVDIECVRVPQSIHQPPYYLPRGAGLGGPSVECSETLQYMLDTMGFAHDGIVMLLDSDMFLVQDFYVNREMEGLAIAATPQYRIGSNGPIEYLLPNLFIFDMERFPDKESFNCNMGYVDGTLLDSAGFTCHYLIDHPDLPIWRLEHIKSPFNPETRSYTEFIYPPELTKEPRKFTLTPSEMEYLKQQERLFKAICTMQFDYEFFCGYKFLHFRAGSNWYNMSRGKMNKKTEYLKSVIEDCI